MLPLSPIIAQRLRYTEGFPYLHEEDGVKYDERLRQRARDVSVLVEPKHAGPRGHRHGLDAFHVASVRVFWVVVDAGVNPVFVERVI